VLEKINRENKYAYIADMSGSLGTYFEYSGHHFFNFQALNKGVLMKKKTKEEVQEEFRKAFVHCMQRGKHLIVNLANTIPNIPRDYDSKVLPLTELLLVPEKLNVDFLKIVKDSENTDVAGQAKGCYAMHADFMVIFYTDAGDPDFDDSMIQMALDTIPLVNTMTKLYVQEE
jgi:hypothetical protein